MEVIIAYITSAYSLHTWVSHFAGQLLSSSVRLDVLQMAIALQYCHGWLLWFTVVPKGETSLQSQVVSVLEQSVFKDNAFPAPIAQVLLCSLQASICIAFKHSDEHRYGVKLPPLCFTLHLLGFARHSIWSFVQIVQTLTHHIKLLFSSHVLRVF